MQDYVSQLLNSFKSTKTEPKSEKKIKPSLKRNFRAESKEIKSAEEILENLKRMKYDFEKLVLTPARELKMNGLGNGGDKSNPHLKAVYDVEEAFRSLEDHLKAHMADPFKDEDGEMGADAPLNTSDLNTEPVQQEPAAEPMEPEISLEEDSEEDSEEDVPAVQPTVIDEWEFLESDPEYYGNPTLLYDKGSYVVFIQKDSDPENELPYMVQTAGFGNLNKTHQDANISELCKWLEVNEYPVPTAEACDAIDMALGSSLEESVNESDDGKNKSDKEATVDDYVKIPDGMKRAQDNPEITKLAPRVEDPKVAKIDEPEKQK